ncbi:hypothetical protein EVAR_11787_1 [Eumeta japonica]|uniref:Uncharacterized protein n=1 Tax=Eumeta variegata TaxID=151549 RepID=A0A4C1UPH1_EUMVA|nr:hypothetical protein EVAR_11787_1 [Eumeta japonica]
MISIDLYDLGTLALHFCPSRDGSLYDKEHLFLESCSTFAVTKEHLCMYSAPSRARRRMADFPLCADLEFMLRDLETDKSSFLACLAKSVFTLSFRRHKYRTRARGGGVGVLAAGPADARPPADAAGGPDYVTPSPHPVILLLARLDESEFVSCARTNDMMKLATE